MSAKKFMIDSSIDYTKIKLQKPEPMQGGGFRIKISLFSEITSLEFVWL